ncbi:hypothetical protein BLL38_08960 [Pseudomonas gessardii]|nr:hypothetical protein BLL38_08960 [Pseudomonas gessardii]
MFETYVYAQSLSSAQRLPFVMTQVNARRDEACSVMPHKFQGGIKVGAGWRLQESRGEDQA